MQDRLRVIVFIVLLPHQDVIQHRRNHAEYARDVWSACECLQNATGLGSLVMGHSYANLSVASTVKMQSLHTIQIHTIHTRREYLNIPA